MQVLEDKLKRLRKLRNEKEILESEAALESVQNELATIK
jgi:hypothetical protein